MIRLNATNEETLEETLEEEDGLVDVNLTTYIENLNKFCDLECC